MTFLCWINWKYIGYWISLNWQLETKTNAMEINSCLLQSCHLIFIGLHSLFNIYVVTMWFLASIFFQRWQLLSSYFQRLHSLLDFIPCHSRVTFIWAGLCLCVPTFNISEHFYFNMILHSQKGGKIVHGTAVYILYKFTTFHICLQRFTYLLSVLFSCLLSWPFESNLHALLTLNILVYVS